MPQCYAVPLCSNRGPGHRFPQDLRRRKAWLIAIRRDKYVVTKHSRVCKEHFKESEFILPKFSVLSDPKPQLKPDAIPSVFEWTKEPSRVSLGRADRVKKRSIKKMNLSHGDEEVEMYQELPITINIADSSSDQEDIQIMDDSYVHKEEIICTSHEDSSPSSASNVDHRETEPNCECLGDVSSDIGQVSLVEMEHQQCSHAMRINDYKSDSKKAELQFYTGFETYHHFFLVFNALGSAVSNLKYYSKYSVNGSNDPGHLLPEDQFFLTLIKLRRFMLNKELAFRFNISVTVVSCILITWINFLYCQFQEIDIWPSHDALVNLCSLKGNKAECISTCIVDCTEIRIVKPKKSHSSAANLFSLQGL